MISLVIFLKKSSIKKVIEGVESSLTLFHSNLKLFILILSRTYLY